MRGIGGNRRLIQKKREIRKRKPTKSTRKGFGLLRFSKQAVKVNSWEAAICWRVCVLSLDFEILVIEK